MPKSALVMSICLVITIAWSVAQDLAMRVLYTEYENLNRAYTALALKSSAETTKFLRDKKFNVIMNDAISHPEQSYNLCPAYNKPNPINPQIKPKLRKNELDSMASVAVNN